MSRRQISLVGLIQQHWISDGSPSLSWEDLLQRTIAADEELERNGHDPAQAFRRYRKSQDPEQMQRYVQGFYRYPFCPDNSESNVGTPSVTRNSHLLPKRGETQPKDSKDIKAKMDQIRRDVMDILEKLEPKKPNQDLAEHISSLEKKGHIPKHVASMMHTLRIQRNLVLYENHMPDSHEWSVIENAWAAVWKWWESKTRQAK